jgi:hypothetical protein
MHNHFYDFISKSNLLATAIGFLASTQVISLVNSFFDNIIGPIINYILTRHNHPKLKEYHIKLDEVEIEIGAFLLSLITLKLNLKIKSKRQLYPLLDLLLISSNVDLSNSSIYNVETWGIKCKQLSKSGVTAQH